MFYRFMKAGGRIPVDLDNMYHGTCFIAGGSPILLKEDLGLLNQRGLNILAMNNAASVVPANLWVGGDKPGCYSKRVLYDQSLMKFAIISRASLEVEPNLKLSTLSNMFFFGTSTDFNSKNLLRPHRDLVWWKNTFYIAIQLAFRLGFRKIYLIGCQFKISEENQYSYKSDLDKRAIDWNQRTYNQVVTRMKELKPHFEDYKLTVKSSTPDSPLNETFGYVSMKLAVEDALRGFPLEFETQSCNHSSFYTKKKEGDK